MVFNPYRQIPETISKNRAVTQGIFRKLFPGKFHEYLPMKKYFPICGKIFRKFSWVITRIFEISNFILNHRFWKEFPENPLSHSPKVCLYGLNHLMVLVEKEAALAASFEALEDL